MTPPSDDRSKNPYVAPGGEAAPELAASRGSLLVVFLTVFIDLLGFGIVLPLLPMYGADFAERYQLTDTQRGWMIGLLMASFSAMQFIFLPIWGRLSDRVGRRPVLMVGLASSTLFYAMFGIATVERSLVLLFIARIGAGIAGATISTAQAYIADVTTKQNRAKGMALIGAAFALGFMLGPLLGIASLTPGLYGLSESLSGMIHGVFSSTPFDAAAAARFSPLPGFMAATLSAIAFLIAVFKLRESWRPGVAQAARRMFDLSALRDAMRVPSIGLLLLASFIAVFSFACFESTLSLQVEAMVKHEQASHDQGEVFSSVLAWLIRNAQNWNYAPDQIKLVVSFEIFAFLGIVLTLAQGVLVRRLAGRMTEARMAVVGGVTAIIGFWLLAWSVYAQAFGLFVLGMTIEVVGFAFVNPSLQSLVSRRSDPARQGAMLGLSQSAASLARIFGPGVGPPLLLWMSSAPYVLASALMIVGLSMVVIAARGGQDYPHH